MYKDEVRVPYWGFIETRRLASDFRMYITCTLNREVMWASKGSSNGIPKRRLLGKKLSKAVQHHAHNLPGRHPGQPGVFLTFRHSEPIHIRFGFDVPIT